MASRWVGGCEWNPASKYYFAHYKKKFWSWYFFFILQLNNKIPNRKSFKWNVGLLKVLVASIFQPLNIEELSSKVRFPKRWLLKRLYCTNVSSDLRSIHLLLHCVSWVETAKEVTPSINNVQHTFQNLFSPPK